MQKYNVAVASLMFERLIRIVLPENEKGLFDVLSSALTEQGISHNVVRFAENRRTYLSLEVYTPLVTADPSEST